MFIEFKCNIDFDLNIQRQRSFLMIQQHTYAWMCRLHMTSQSAVSLLLTAQRSPSTQRSPPSPSLPSLAAGL